MKFKQTKISGLILIEPNVFSDERGYFFESFRSDIFEKEIGEIKFIQDNESFSQYGSLRGLHYQISPFAQNKLVRVVSGEVLDIAVDLRRNSPTFKEHISFVLSDKNKLQVFIPAGFAHGFVTLSESAVFQYKVDNIYSKDSERGIIFSDSDLNINWMVQADKLIVSEKDRQLPTFKSAEYFD